MKPSSYLFFLAITMAYDALASGIRSKRSHSAVIRGRGHKTLDGHSGLVTDEWMTESNQKPAQIVVLEQYAKKTEGNSVIRDITRDWYSGTPTSQLSHWNSLVSLLRMTGGTQMTSKSGKSAHQSNKRGGFSLWRKLPCTGLWTTCSPISPERTGCHGHCRPGISVRSCHRIQNKGFRCIQVPV